MGEKTQRKAIEGRPSNHKKRVSSIDVAVWVAIIAALSTIIVALINNGSFDKLFHRSYPSPAISISSDVRDINGNPIAMDSAPFQVSIKGTVSNTDGYYVYLIVANKYHHYVQPGLGLNANNDFSEICQLGEEHNPDSYSQQYIIYAVITDKPYADFAWFEGESYIAKSKELKITREPMSIPITTP